MLYPKYDDPKWLAIQALAWISQVTRRHWQNENDPVEVHAEYAGDGSNDFIAYAQRGFRVVWSSGWTSRREALRRLADWMTANLPQ